MPTPTSVLGIDIGKHALDAATAAEPAQRFDNTPEGRAALIAAFAAHPPALVVVEATGGYELAVVLGIQQAGWPIAVVNPRQVRAFARATGTLAKTDAVDARLLARFGDAVRPVPLPLVDPGETAFAALVARRRQVVEAMVAEKNRLEHAQPAIARWIAQHLDHLKAQLVQVDEAIALAVAATPKRHRRHAILTSVPGVGALTAAVVIAELPELGSSDPKKLAALVGVAPFNRDSGTHRGERHIQGGRASLRCALYMATLTAVRHNPSLKAFYRRLRDNGKKPKVPLIAATRKLVTLLNALVRDDTPWTPQQHGC